MDENNGKNKGHANLIPLKKGQTANPNGRPLGQKNYSTLYREALIKIAESEDTTPDEIELDLIRKGIRRAGSDYKFYKDVLDRTHGTAIQKSELTGNIKVENLEAIQKATKEILNG